MWKFCIFVHKLLHEGHQQILYDSFEYVQQFVILGNFWTAQSTHHLSQCIASYCQLLQRKLTFHQTYRHFKGNFEYEYEKDLDLNTVYQLSLDMCDYLQDLLHLQRLIFINLKTDQIIPDSKKGLCRLTALVTILAECNLLYRHTVDVLRLLHSQLPPDDISGLTERFNNNIFVELQRFYEQVRLISVPSNYFEIPELPVTSPIVTDQYYGTSSMASMANRNNHELSAPFFNDFD
ncbi:huntington interacting protein related 1-like isoform X2 [Musca autumnalis]